MKLLLSQKNELYDLIERSGLSPSMFEFTEINSQIAAGQYATLLAFKNSGFFFSFETGFRTETSHFAIFSPGRESIKETQNPGSWDLQLRYFIEWLTYLLREINAPNKWDRLKSEIAEIGINTGGDETKFTAFEYENLKQRIQMIKNEVNNIHLNPEELSIIHSKLDHLLELAKEMNKFDWKALFVGTFVSIIIQLSLSPEIGKLLWDIIRQFFNNFLLP
jgi:hypothetical protein